MDASVTTRRQPGSGHPLFILGLAAVGLSIVAFLAIVVAAAAGGDDNGADPFLSALIGTATPRPTDAPPDTPTPSATATDGGAPAEQVGDEAPTPEGNGGSQGDNGDGGDENPADDGDVRGQGSQPTPDNSIVVACGDPYARLDKQHRLPADCVPADLVQLPAEVSIGAQYLTSGAADAFIRLVEAAAADGFQIVAVSAYRSYDEQVFTYNSNVAQFGQEYADRTSARPGHSEHQLGTTVDVSSASAGYGLESFIGTPEAAWIEANAGRFGFTVSYPDGAEPITGYAYEPWHIRWRP